MTKRTKLEGMKSADSVCQEISPDERVIALTKTNSRLLGKIEALKDDYGAVKVFFEEIAGLTAASTPLPLLNDENWFNEVDGDSLSFNLHLGDWHAGAVQEASEVENFGEFSPDILHDRILDKLLPKILQHIQMYKSVHNIDECVVICTGDFISGDIHDELTRTNAFPITEQVIFAANLLASLIGSMAPYFPKIRLEFVSLDNHGRLTKKYQFKEGGKNSANYLVGYIAKLVLANHKNVECNIYPMAEKIIEVKGRRYLTFHGHGIKSWMGIPFYGINRQVAREAKARMNMMESYHFNLAVMGHFHTSSYLPEHMLEMCGSVSGTDAFDHSAGRHAEPAQTSWFTHPKYGEINWNRWQLK